MVTLSAKFNNKEFYYSVTLMNSKGQVIPLLRSAVLSLSISTNIFDTFARGTAILLNTFNVLDQLDRNVLPFTFMNDGRDILSVRIMQPVTGSSNDFVNDKLTSLFMIHHDFVITECTDITYKGTLCKKLKLVEWDEYILREKQCTVYSSLLIDPTQNIMALTNGERQVATGKILEAIITKALPSAKIGANFDQGATELYFESKSNMSCYDALQYVHKFHAGTQNRDYCFLSLDRKNREYSLLPISEIFNNHWRYATETITWATGGDIHNMVGTSTNMSWKSSPIRFGEDSEIMRSHIIEPAAEINLKAFNSISILAVSKPDNALIVDNRSGHITTAIQNYNNWLVVPFNSLHVKCEPSINVNRLKQLNDAVNIEATPEPLFVAQGIANKNLLALMCLGTCYKFTLRGVTSRKPLTFVDIKRTGVQSNISNFDRKHCGRHFVTAVEHVFEDDEYITNIETIKTYKVSK